MQKNPWSTTYSQPPLPPGPPPPPQQPDYSAYWASAQQPPQQQQQPSSVPTYNPQWSAPQPPSRPSDPALYANYGYGNQQHSQWQQRQGQQRHQQPPPYHPPPPPAQPPPPSAGPSAYAPYQPAAPYSQPYVPQHIPQQPIPIQPSFSAPPPQQQQPFMPRPPPTGPVHHQPHPIPQIPMQPNHNMHNGPGQHPAKRQRFDGPGHNPPNRQPTGPHGQFQPPSGPSFQAGRGGGNIPSGPSHGGRGGARGGGGGGGGGMGRGVPPSASRGGMSGRGMARGGGHHHHQGGGGGLNRGGANGSVRGHGSRGTFSTNRDHNRRAGGGSFSKTNSANFSQGRGGRNQTGHNNNRSLRRDNSGSVSGPKEGTMNSSFGGKKDENRRTLTDFKLIGLELQEIHWSWGIVPTASTEHAEEDVKVKIEPSSKAEHTEHPDDDRPAPQSSQASTSTEVLKTEDQSGNTHALPTAPGSPSKAPAGNSSKDSSAPSRMRIYFHTPVSNDDSHPIPHLRDTPSDSRKGKRKKLDDDDVEMDERRTRPRPQMSEERAGSVAPSVSTEVAGEDWLMAAVHDSDANGSETEPKVENDADADHSHTTEGGDADESYFEATQPMYNDEEEDVEVEDDLMNHDAEGEDDDMIYGDQKHASLPGFEAGTSGHEHESSLDQDHTAEAPEQGSSHEAQSEASSTAVADANGDTASTPRAQSPHHASLTSAEPSHAVPVSTALPLDMTSDAVQNAVKDVLTLMTGSSSLSLEPFTLETASSSTTLEDDASTQDGTGQSKLTEGPPHSAISPSVSTAAEGPSLIPASASVSRTPSANRLSISYANGNRRLVIDADVVKSLKVFRSEGRVEVVINAEKLTEDDADGLKGFLIEQLSNKSYISVPTLSAEADSDATLPPFTKLSLPASLTLIVHLDTAKPLSEPKWVKTGDVQDWLKTMFGRMFWVAGEAAESGWEKRIEVVDPDPPPTLQSVMEGWANNSTAGLPNERHRFLKTHMTEMENILEILLRLVRGERATPFLQTGPTVSEKNLSGPLLSALTPGSAHGSQQTHVSLAVMAIFRMAADFATTADGENGKKQAEERVGEIIRCLPSHLLYKSLDGMFKEWRVEMKGR